MKLQLISVQSLPLGSDCAHVILTTSDGEIECVFRPTNGDSGIIWVCGALGGFDGPSFGIFATSSEALQSKGISSLRLNYRFPGDFDQCVLDVLIGVHFLQQQGVDNVALVGHSFGGFIAALEAEGLPTSDALLSEGYNSGWMPFAIYFSLGMQYDHTTALSRISCPVLVIHAEDDITMTSEGVRSYIDNIDNTVLEIIEDAGHHSFNDRPEEFAGIVSEFLASGHR